MKLYKGKLYNYHYRYVRYKGYALHPYVGRQKMHMFVYDHKSNFVNYDGNLYLHKNQIKTQIKPVHECFKLVWEL